MLTAVLLCLPIFSVFAESPEKNHRFNATGATDSEVFSPLPQVSATAAVLIEASTGKVIGGKNAHKRMPMASTTKIMTALVAIENSNIDDVVSISPLAVGIEGSSVYLYEGERLTIKDLLYALLLESANDAATAIAIAVGGSVEGFAALMNQKAAELQLQDTHFTNPHGLDDPEHYTTALELAKIAAAAMKSDIFKSIVSTYKITIPLNETEGVRLLINHNKLLKSYKGATGIKTGYTKKSGRCLVSAAEHDGVELIAVTLNAPDDWQDHKNMLDYGFSQYESRLLCAEGGFQHMQPIICGTDSYVLVKNGSEVRVTVPRDSNEIKQTVEMFRFSYAPISEGEQIGRLVYTSDGEILAETPLLATYTVNKVNYKKTLWEKICSLFGR